MLILGIETSCDETAAAVVEDGTKVLSSVVASSEDLHRRTGGIVPEVAAREQIGCIIPVIKQALNQAQVKPLNLQAIAVTIGGPGLIGSLLVGVETAKTLSLVWQKPLIPVVHVYGHIYANWLIHPPPLLPAVALTVAGGHSDLFLITQNNQMQWLGGTRDDSAGEAFDKVAQLLGLTYPGGPAIEKVAREGTPHRFEFPRPLLKSRDYDFSFSGLKTAVLKTVSELQHHHKSKQLPAQLMSDVAASFQQAVVDTLVYKTVRAAQQHQVKTVMLAGGVAANQKLRQELQSSVKQLLPTADCLMPDFKYCTDNAAYIAAYAFFHFKPRHWTKVTARPNVDVLETVRR